VEGETLADRLERGPIPIADALHIARQVCDALEAAREKGIVHRDLKPANIKLGPENAVKVLDFGLAKVLVRAGESSGASLDNSPTMTSPVRAPRGSGGRTPTQAGIILGTAAYMSPEQARGLPVDARTDIFSFGCVLYEMLTGRRAFPGDTISDILAAILKSDPDFAALPADLDPRLKLLLERALNKNHRQRWQAIGDVRIEIEEAIAHPPSPVSGSGKTTAPRRNVDRMAWPLAAVSLVAAIGLGTGWIRSRSSDSPVAMPAFRLSLSAPEGSDISAGGISPDGSRVIFATFDPSRPDPISMWIRHLNSGETRPTDIPPNAFWSPDSGSVRISTDGGTSPRWRRDGAELFYAGLKNTVMAVSVTTDVTFTAKTPVPLFQPTATRSIST
jgi:eukaryotic-like serine/threonine-protein kinase